MSGVCKKKKKTKSPSFRLPAKFKAIKKVNRLKYLIAHLKENAPNTTLEDMSFKRRGFDYSKNYQYPLKGKQCYVCEEPAAIRHHVVPLSKGGRNKKNNIVPLCHPCHCKVHPHMRKGVKKGPKLVFPVYHPALCKPKQDVVVIPPSIIKNSVLYM